MTLIALGLFFVSKAWLTGVSWQKLKRIAKFLHYCPNHQRNLGPEDFPGVASSAFYLEASEFPTRLYSSPFLRARNINGC